MSDSSKSCYKCGRVGHLAWACYKKREREDTASGTSIPHKQQQNNIKSKVTRCFVCRKLGHLAKKCPSIPASVSSKYYDLDGKRNEDSGGPLIIDEDDIGVPPPPTLGNYAYEDLDGTAITQALDSIDDRGWDFIKTDREMQPTSTPKDVNKFYKSVFLNGTKLDAYLDTSSEKCLIKYSAAKRAHLNVQLDDTDVMSQSPSFKGRIVSIGKALATINIDEVEVTNIEVFVIGDENLNIDVVIGRSWLDHPQVVILKTDQILYLANINDRNFEKFRSAIQSKEVLRMLKGGGPFDTGPSASDDDVIAVRNDASATKRRRRDSISKDLRENSPRKNHHDSIFERSRDSDLIRGARSRSRERLRDRDSLREKRSARSRDRSRERSRDRFLNRHAPRR